MKLIETKEYLGFKTKFFILPKIEKFLIEREVDIKDYLIDNFHWYEHVLFELLEKESKHKNFKVVFYGIIEKWVDEKPEGFIEAFKFEESKVLDDSFITIHPKNQKSPFAVRQKILLA